MKKTKVTRQLNEVTAGVKANPVVGGGVADDVYSVTSFAFTGYIYMAFSMFVTWVGVQCMYNIYVPEYVHKQNLHIGREV